MTTAALVAAVETYSQPLVHRRLSRQQLPPGIMDVIKIAAGDEDTISAAMETFAIKREVLIESATFYLQNMLLDAGDNPYRLLCLPDGAPQRDVTAHKRWLLKWLHPDRNKNKWESVLFARVSQAATLIGQKELTPVNAAEQVAHRQPHVRSPSVRPNAARGREHHSSVGQRKLVFFWREMLFRNAARALAILAVTTIAVIAYGYIQGR